MNVTILTDNPNSWFIPYGEELSKTLLTLGHKVNYVFNSKHIKQGDVCFLLSCVKLVGKDILALNRNNIVVHASDLPSGKGFSPLQWQILEGKNEICLTLFEVVELVDAGPYYLKSSIFFEGHELYAELRSVLANKITEMCVYYVQNRDFLPPIEQIGNESFYRRRTESDDELDVNKTLSDLFNQFRISDNENHPAYFYMNKKKYYLKIYADKL